MVSAELVRIKAEGKLVVLFIDEAQAMPEESLVAIQLLTQLDTAEKKHLQVVLFGQPELDELLERPTLGKLGDHLSFNFILPELDRASTEAYITHRISRSGYNGAPLFSGHAIDKIY